MILQKSFSSRWFFPNIFCGIFEFFMSSIINYPCNAFRIVRYTGNSYRRKCEIFNALVPKKGLADWNYHRLNWRISERKKAANSVALNYQYMYRHFGMQSHILRILGGIDWIDHLASSKYFYWPFLVDTTMGIFT